MMLFESGVALYGMRDSRNRSFTATCLSMSFHGRCSIDKINADMLMAPQTLDI